MDSEFLLEESKNSSKIHLELKSPSERKRAGFDENGELLTPPGSDPKLHSHGSNSFHSEDTPSNLNVYISTLLSERDELCKTGQSSFKNTLMIVDREIEKMTNLAVVERKEFGESLYQRRMAKKLNFETSDDPYITISQAVRIPVEEYPNYNFIGRILGPRGMTAKQLERQTGCKIMIRGRYSNKMYGYVAKGNSRRGEERTQTEDELPLRVVIESTGPRKIAEQRVENAVKVLKSLLVPPSDGLDVLKQRQLVELAIMNGTYRPPSSWNTPTLNTSSSPLTDLAAFSMADYPEQKERKPMVVEEPLPKWSPDVTQTFNDHTISLLSQMFETNAITTSQRVSMGDSNNALSNLTPAQLDLFIELFQGKPKRDEPESSTAPYMGLDNLTAAQLLYNISGFTNDNTSH